MVKNFNHAEIPMPDTTNLLAQLLAGRRPLSITRIIREARAAFGWDAETTRDKLTALPYHLTKDLRICPSRGTEGGKDNG